VLVGRDELAGWVGGFGRYSSGRSGSSDLQNWLQLSNAGTVDYCRRTGNPRRVRVRGAAAAVCGTTQPGVIAAVLTPELREAGLFARLLPACPPVRRRTWTEAEVPDGVRRGVTDLLDALFALQFATDDDGRDRPHQVRLGEEAKRLFVAFYDRNGAAMDSADDDLRAAMSKLEGYALRFALLFHCCRHPAAPADERVGAADMAAAIALTDWFVRESDRVYRLLGEPAEDRALRTLAEQVRRKADQHGGRLTVRQLQNSNSRRYPTRELAEADLQRLVDAGFGAWESADPTVCGGHREKWYVPTPTSDTSDGGCGDDPDDGDDPPPDAGPGCPPAEGTVATPEGAGAPAPCAEPLGEPVSEVSDVGLTVLGEDVQPLAPPATLVSEVSDVGPGDWRSEAEAAVHASEVSDVGLAAAQTVVRPGGPAEHPAVLGSCDRTPPPPPLAPTPPAPPVLPTGGPRLVTEQAGLERVAAALRAAKTVGLDTETTGLDPRADRVRLLSLHTPAGTFLVDCFAVDPAPLFGPLAGVEVVGHNLLFDLQFLARLGFAPGRVWDTMLASQVLEAGDRTARHSLLEAAARHLGAAMSKAEQASDWGGELTPAQLAYAAADVDVLLPLRAALLKKLRSAALTTTADLENRALPAVGWMAGTGVGFDRTAWEALAGEAGGEASSRQADLDRVAPARPGDKPRNWNSVPQVKEAFAAVGVTLTSTADAALAAVDHPLAVALRAYRAAAKRCGTYGLDWLRHVSADGRVHPGWRQCGADSGRMACREPNVQNLPRDPRYRRCFAAPPGRALVKADYSQIELRLAAKISQDPVMLAAYQQGKDLHAETARAILGKAEVSKADRQLAKAINFGLLYGMGAATFAAYARTNYGVTLTAGEAAGYRAKFFRTYPGLAAWHRRQGGGNRAADTRTPLGRRRAGVTRYTEKLNTPVQGAGADGLKQALALLWERRAECPAAVPVLAVHDEIVVECDAVDADAVSAWLTRAMVDGMAPFAAPVPVVVETSVGPTWGG
jgi:DNA polymerase I-like protein with 3'-5' exonuclease and polymerase domains